ncbi:flagellar protein [Helicobacter fennelliae]|uniref:Flagellar protein FliL n=1 Tax=Helicobacter fennelliae TaxID=215 RepID=A0A2X3BDQ4_9HELI|nr:flagellar basal body-associated FliL family protein [Helicobacter fennelliae]SQB98991.1 flagellar protein [Helicobacter fennelliae]
MAEEEKDEQQESKKGNKSLLFIITGVVVALIIIGVVVIMLLGGGSEEESPKDHGTQSATNKKAPLSSDAVSLMNVGPIYPLAEPFIINLASQGRDYYMQISISLALDSEKLQPEIEKKLDIIRNVIIDVFSTKTPEDMKTPKGRNKAVDEIRDRINEFLVDGNVTQVIYSNVIIQQG